MGEEKRAFKGVWICAAVFLDEKLTPAEKILLGEIDSLTTDDHGCYASNAHFAKRLGVTESRANHVVARLTREGYIVRVYYDGRISQRVVAPELSSNPATSRRLIERNRRLAKNNSSELSRLEDSNSELLKIATVTSQKEQPRTAKNSGALLLKRVPTENTNRKTTTTHPDVDNEEGDSKKPAEASSLPAYFVSWLSRSAFNCATRSARRRTSRGVRTEQQAAAKSDRVFPVAWSGVRPV
jgi:hypothetical protein